MRACLIPAHGGIDALTIVERPVPRPAADEVLVRVHAGSLNYRDLAMVRRGLATPVVALSDGAGEIVDVGAGVTTWKPGDRVMSSFFRSWISGPYRVSYGEGALGGGVDGMLAEYVCLPGDAVVEIPEYMSYEEASTLPCAGVTAYNALFGGSRVLMPGDTVLILGTGGVSIYGLQLAKAAGATVVATSGSDAKLERCRALGATHTVNYRDEPEWWKGVRRETGDGADHVLEVIGDLAGSINAAAVGASISIIGTTLAAAPVPPDIGGLIQRKGVVIRGVFVGSTAMLRGLARAMAANEIHPIVDAVYGFDDAKTAYEALAAAQHFGKIVITLG
ncbi:MAG: NAD(P)-dependent alcohol dehydrogenase [Acidimicrobiia bacterium]